MITIKTKNVNVLSGRLFVGLTRLSGVLVKVLEDKFSAMGNP
jgi:hypothetical protein